MRLRDAFIVFLVAAVAACEKAPPPFAREGSVWRYKGTVVEEADAPSFAPLSDHYAKDRQRVYYADTYRKGQEYYSVAHPRVVEIAGADAATFRYMERGYARDASRVYFEGNRPLVRTALQRLEGRLDPAVFFRASRTHVLNLRFIERIEPAVNDGLTVRVRTVGEVPVSRRQARRLRDAWSLDR